MAFLIFAFVIVSILQDYGTLQTKSINQCEPGELTELFKKYALELVNAAVLPLRQNGDIMEWGCDCIPIVKEGDNEQHMDAILATLSLAKDYHEDLVVMSQPPDPSTSANSIKNGTVENLRKILIVLEKWSVRLPTSPSDNVFDKYLMKHEGGPGSGDYEKRWESVRNCYRSLLSMEFTDNKTFFDKLAVGFEIAAGIKSDDDNGRVNPSKRTDLSNIIQEISQFELTFSTQELHYLEDEVNKIFGVVPGDDDSDSGSQA